VSERLPARIPRGEQRVSDLDRERTALTLRSHYEAGRLDAQELEERLGAVYSAITRRQLRALVADLPRVRPPAPGGWQRIHRAAVRVHAAGWAAGNGTVVGIWALTGGGEFWPAWVLAPTSAFLAAHAYGLPAAVRAFRRRR
jgi:hypothetical protein